MRESRAEGNFLQRSYSRPRHRVLLRDWATAPQLQADSQRRRRWGIQKQSLYGAFGDKRSLLLKCLSLYTKQTLLEIQKMLNESDSALEGIERVLRYASQPTDSKKCPAGCLMTNTALELGLDDAGVAEEVRIMFRGFEKLLGAAVRKAQAQGEIGKNLDSAAVGQNLANTISGIRILEKTGAPKQQARTIVETALAAIRR